MKNFRPRKIFIGILFAVLFVGELSFQIFTNGERTLINLAVRERAALDSVLTHADVLIEKARAEKRAMPLESGKAIYVELNRRAAVKKDLFAPYSKMIVDADKQIAEAWKPHNDLVAQRQELIRAEFSQRRTNADSVFGNLTGIQYGVSASLLACGLAFFSTLIFDRWRWIVFAAAFVAQYTACLMIYHGAMLKFGDETQAAAFAVMFFCCAPLAFHFGTMLFEMERLGDPLMATVTRLEQTDSVELSRKQVFTHHVEQVPVKSVNPATWEEACEWIKSGRLDWSSRKVVKTFPGVSRYRVEQMIAHTPLPAGRDPENE